MNDIMIGVDLAKNVFRLHGALMTGQLKFRKKLTRPQFRQFMSDQPPAMVVMEACGSASFWAREMIKLGPQSLLAHADDGEEAADVGSHRAGQQDGAGDLGHADEEGGLSGSGAGGGMTLIPRKAV